MPIYRYCPFCKLTFALDKDACHKCGRKGRELKYRVIVKTKAGRLSKVVPLLSMAKDVEIAYRDKLLKSELLGERYQKEKDLTVAEVGSVHISV